MTNDEKYSFDYDGENFTINLHGVELVGCQWMPKEKVKYVMIFFHGLGAFLSINRSYFPFLTEKGVAIMGTDHMGHGRSPGDRGNNTYEMLYDEITLLISRANILFPHVPILFYGHSMGGVAILSYVLTHPNEAGSLDGIIVEAPWINTSESLAGSFVHKLIGKFGRILFPSLLINTGEGWGDVKYSKTFIELFERSKLSHPFITPKLYASAYTMQNICWNDIDKWPTDLPLLFMQGGADASVGVERNMQWVDKMRDALKDNLFVCYHREAEHAMLRGECLDNIFIEMMNFFQYCRRRCHCFSYL